MPSESNQYCVDPTPRRADGEYMAHARISSLRLDGSECDIFLSGDLRGFELREDAIAYARSWGARWVEVRSV